MRIIDLSHPIHPTMPVYPGTAPPSIALAATLDKDGFAEHQITFTTHTGTHVDAPSHMLADAETLDGLPLAQFMGPAVMINLNTIASPKIGVSALQRYEDQLHAVEFVLLHTGWNRHWGQSRYFEQFPVLDRKAALWLGNFALKGIGVDTPSFDAATSTGYGVHKLFLSRNVLLIENLTNLDCLPTEPFTMACFPLPLRQADGCPVRAVALIE